MTIAKLFLFFVFLTESDKGTDALPIVIESEEEERDLDSLTENTIIASVLSSLSLSLFTVTKALTSSIHWRGEHLGLNEGPWISGVESHCHMSGEGPSAFPRRWKENLCKEHRGPVQGRILVEHRMRWELAQRCGNGY